MSLFIESLRNSSTRFFPGVILKFYLALCILILFSITSFSAAFEASTIASTSRVVIVKNKSAVSAYLPEPQSVKEMLKEGLFALTSTSSLKDAFSKIFTTNDIVGIKVYSAPGPYAGSRPAVARALVSLMIESDFPTENIIIWDKNLTDLQSAGYDKIANEFGIRIAGAIQSSYDESVYYEKPLIGSLVYGDYEFGKKAEGTGKKSYISKLVTKEITKIVSIAPLLNHNVAGIVGHLYSISMGGVDNTLRFESNKERLNEAVPEIFALPVFSDRAVLFITDALICQYEGGERALLHYSTTPSELRLSRDPVALDLLSLEELQRQRVSVGIRLPKIDYELFNNAALLELGNADSNKIKITRINLQQR